MRKQGKATTRPQMVGYRPGAPKQNRGYKQPEPHYTADDVSRAFKAGLMLGALVVLVIGVLIMWGWVIPTMDGAVETSRQALENSMSGAVMSV